jgi:hypothetical protein
VAVLSGGFSPALCEEVGRLIVRYGKKELESERIIEVRRGETVSRLTVYSLPASSPAPVNELPMASLESDGEVSLLEKG